MPIRRQSLGIRGTSLIEVLITLGIFLTGMAYVVRLFPFGFLSLKHDESVTIANRLAQADLERLEGRAANLPCAILPWGWCVSNYGIRPDIDPDNMGDITPPENAAFPDGMPMHYYTDVNKFRRVVGEATPIPAPMTIYQGNQQIRESRYALQFSPIVYDPTGKIAPDDTVQVYAGSLRRRWMGPGSIASKLQSYGDYLIDYETTKIYLKPFTGGPRVFTMSYGYWSNLNGTPELMSGSVNVQVPAANAAEVSQGYVEFDIPAPSTALIAAPADPSQLLKAVLGFEGIDRASDTLARAFRELGSSDAWSNDPYEFKVVNDAGTVPGMYGVLAFNPCGYNYDEYTSRGKTPLVANIDYTVMDWHILHEERRTGVAYKTQTDLDVKLTLRFLKKAGESPEADGTTYDGLAPYYGIKGDVIALDMETGQMYSSDPNDIQHYYLDPGTNQRPAMEVDYQHGIIHFDPMFSSSPMTGANQRTSPMTGKTFKIFYQAEGDWALQTYKAYDAYRRSYGSSGNPLGEREYLFSGGMIYFSRAAAGSTVAMDFAYTVNGGPEVFTSGQVHQVSKDTSGSGNYVYVDLLDKIQNEYGTGAQINITRITRVYGVSLGVRAVWRESGRGFSAGRWRKVDLQTYLTRPAQ